MLFGSWSCHMDDLIVIPIIDEALVIYHAIVVSSPLATLSLKGCSLDFAFKVGGHVEWRSHSAWWTSTCTGFGSDTGWCLWNDRSRSILSWRLERRSTMSIKIDCWVNDLAHFLFFASFSLLFRRSHFTEIHIWAKFESWTWLLQLNDNIEVGHLSIWVFFLFQKLRLLIKLKAIVALGFIESPSDALTLPFLII